MIRAVARKKDPTAAPPYLSHFRLQQAPFSPNGGPAFFYGNAEREQYLNMLLHLTQYSEELLLVTGMPGVGKTALLQKYLSRADDHWQICRIEGSATAAADALFLRIAECFRLDLAQVPPDQLLGALSAHLNRVQQQMTPVLVIDDAEKLLDDALEIVLRLATLEGEHGRLIRVTLFAQPDIAERLKAPRFEAIPEPHRLDLHPMEEEDTGAYLNHRLRAAGYSGATPFTPKLVRRIQKASRGVPSAINGEAHDVLCELSGTSGSALKRRLPWLATAAAVLAVLAVITLFGDGLPLGGERETPGASEPTAAASAQPPNAPEPPRRPIVRNGDPGREAASYTMVLQAGESLTVRCAAPTGPAPAAEPAPGPPAPATERQPSPRPDVAPTPSAEAVRPHIARVEPTQMTAGGRRTVVLHGEGFAPLANVAVSWGEGARVLPPEQVELLDPNTIRITLDVGDRPDQWAVQVTGRNGDRSNVVRFQVTAPGATPPQLPPEAAPSARTEPVEPEVGPSEPRSDQPEAVPTPSGEPAPEVAPSPPAQIPSPEPEPEPEPKPEASEPTAERALITPAPSEPPAPEPRPGPVPPAAQPQPVPPAQAERSPPVPTAGLYGEAWVQAQPAGHVTIQLLAAAQPETLEQYVAEHRIAGPLAQYRTRRDGQILSILVQGSYPSRADAEAAVGRLPARVRRGNPWVREFSAVQDDVIESRPTAETGIQGADWVWARDPRHFTVQLAAAGQRSNLTDVLASNPLSPVAIVESRRNELPWYLLLYGNFSSHDAAESAVADLPRDVRRTGPWPRRFAEVHAELDRGRRSR